MNATDREETCLRTPKSASTLLRGRLQEFAVAPACPNCLTVRPGTSKWPDRLPSPAGSELNQIARYTRWRSRATVGRDNHTPCPDRTSAVRSQWDRSPLSRSEYVADHAV